MRAECTAPAGTSGARSPAVQVCVRPPQVSVSSAVENDVRGVHRVRVVLVRGMRPVRPDVDAPKAFFPQLPLERCGVHVAVYRGADLRQLTSAGRA